MLRREKKGCAETATLVISRLGDYPDPLPLAGRVRRQDAAPIDYGGVIQAAVFVIEVAPVAIQMAGQELIGRLSGILEGFEGTRCCDDLTGVTFGFGGLIYAHEVAPIWDLWLFTVGSVVSDAGRSSDSPAPCLLPVGVVTVVGFTRLTMPRVGFVFLVDAAPVFSQFEGFVLGTFFGAVDQEFTPGQHPVVTQGIADDEPTVGQSEHQDDGAVPELTDDLAAAGEHRATVPPCQGNLPVT